MDRTPWPEQNTTVYRFRLGSFRGAVVGDGLTTFPAYPNYAPTASPEEVDAALAAWFLPPRNYTLQLNALVIDTGMHRVLIDTGAGPAFGPTLGKLAANLVAAQIPLTSIDTVVLTHGHIDHIGGLIGAGGLPTFPNARYVLTEEEWGFWANRDLQPADIPFAADPTLKEYFAAAARQQLLPLAERVTIVRPGREIVPGIAALALPGHTSGHIGVQIADGGEQLLHAADLFHHPAFDLAHPDWPTAFDHDPAQAQRTRRRLLDQAAADRTLLMAYHMPFPALGHVRARGSAYEWKPVFWSFGG